MFVQRGLDVGLNESHGFSEIFSAGLKEICKYDGQEMQMKCSTATDQSGDSQRNLAFNFYSLSFLSIIAGSLQRKLPKHLGSISASSVF